MLALGLDDLGDEMLFEQISHYLNNEYFVLNKDYTVEKLYPELLPSIPKELKEIALSQKLLIQSLTHKSFFHETKKKFDHNERLEFLGDAVIELIVTDLLLKNHQDFSEGKLSKLRSSIVNENSLSILAKGIQLEKIVLLGKGECKSKGYLKSSILSDTYEAVIGAIYQEKGFESARTFFLKSIELSQIDILNPTNLEKFDARTQLQELTMKLFKIIPQFHCVETEKNGINGFEIECKLNDVLIAKDFFNSKKKGMQELSRYILENKLIEKDMEKLC